MSTLTRKQREVCERELKLLNVARCMLVEQGYAGLNMDRLAEATEYSKGTVYHHFRCKEDLVTALAVQSSEQRLALIERARQFAGRPREKMLAIIVADELFARLHPHFFCSELVIKMANLEERASDERRETLTQIDRTAFGWLLEIVQAAVNVGDLYLEAPRTAESIVFAMFAQVVGTHTAIRNYGEIVENLKIKAPFSVLRNNLDALLDGFGWRPLQSKWDYAKTYRRIVEEVFPEECRSVGIVSARF